MEHETFEDSAAAAFMNEHFINIKVDREERPVVNGVYMTAMQLMTKRGGWPLNAVSPFFVFRLTKNTKQICEFSV